LRAFNLVRYPVEPAAEPLGFLNAVRADENGLSSTVNFANFHNESVFLVLHRLKHRIRMVHANHRSIGGNHLHIEIVGLSELPGLSRGSAGHAANHGIECDQILKRDRAQNPALFFGRDAFLCFDGGVKTSGPSSILDDASLEFVHGFDGAILDQIVDVAPKQGMGMNGVLNGSMQLEVLRFKEIAAAERCLYVTDAGVG
jgi:hypothetical protein